jgi:hypothetical protein
MLFLLVLRDPAVLVTLKMEYVNITLNNILSIYRSEHMVINTTVHMVLSVLRIRMPDPGVNKHWILDPVPQHRVHFRNVGAELLF